MQDPRRRMEKSVTPSSLEHIRREIDEVDRAMLELLERRFAAIEAIRAVKGQENARVQSPMRPAREAEILRRLYRVRQGSVPVQLMVRLWRSIISAATSVQAPVKVHIAEDVHSDHQLRDATRDYFAGLPMQRHEDAGRVIEALKMTASDIGVVRTGSDWIAPLVQSQDLRIMGMLPFVAPREHPPALFILGRAEAEPSGDDETLISLMAGDRLTDKHLWQVKAGEYSCIALHGFFDEKSPELERLQGSGRDVRILGRCPCPLEASL
jgi:chorismate mutase/prephenate dehydratase